jgi:hypothetical protein
MVELQLWLRDLGYPDTEQVVYNYRKGFVKVDKLVILETLGYLTIYYDRVRYRNPATLKRRLEG